MKKILTLLLILTMTVVGPVYRAGALEEDEMQPERKTTQMPAEYQYDEHSFYIDEIMPRDGLVSLEMYTQWKGELGWEISRAWFATVNYEQGWTEAEADARLEDWTELTEEWTGVAVERTFSDMAPHASATLALKNPATKREYDFTEVNLLDILYYRAEFRLKGDEAEPIIVVGKVDYRGCVHAEEFETGVTSSCKAQAGAEAGTARMLPDGAVAQEVITWEEEWRLELAGRLNEVARVLEGLEMLMEVPEEVLDQQGDKLDGIEGLLEKATGVDTEKNELVRLRAWIAALREGRHEGDEEDETEAEGSGPSVGGDVGAGSGAGSGIGTGSGESGGGAGAGDGEDVDWGGATGEETGGTVSAGGAMTDGEAAGGESTTGEGDIAADQGGGLTNNNNAEANGGAIGANNNSTAGVNSGAGVDLGVNDVAMGDALGGFVSLVRENDDEPQEEVEVPTLGAAKAGRGWIWWTMGMSGGALLFLALVWRRKRGDEVER